MAATPQAADWKGGGVKAYKIELLIVDHDELGPEEIKTVIENQKFPNWCISPNVMNVEERDIGEWGDDHLLNSLESMASEYERIFP